MVRRTAALALCALAGCDASGTVNNGAAVPTTTLRVSLSADEREGRFASHFARISGGGTAVAFLSTSPELHPDVPPGQAGLYVKDLRTRRLALASRRSGAAGAIGPSGGTPGGLSRDGLRVAFITVDALDPADADALEDVYVRDLATDETLLVSRGSGPTGAKANARSYEAALSADGLHVAFSTVATNLDPADTDVRVDVYVRNLAAGTTELVSRASGASGVKGDWDSIVPSVSEDASRVAFVSKSTNLWTAPVPQIWSQVYVRDRGGTPTTTLVSRPAGPAFGYGDRPSFTCALSSDGRFVGFASSATDLHPEDRDVGVDVYVRDLQTEALDLVSRASGAAGVKSIAAVSGGLHLSQDGRFVAFESEAANLVPDDNNGQPDVFIRDRSALTTTRVSVRTFGSEIPKMSFGPGISEDGRSALFSSAASGVVDDDFNGVTDAFVRSPLR